MKKPLALVDLDGTLADFAGAMRRDLELIRDPAEPPGQAWDDNNQPPHIKARWSMIKRQPDWWLNLEFLPAGKRILEILKFTGYRTHILTRAPRKLPQAWEQKVRWCALHVPGVDVTMTPDKHMVYGNVLVDDWPDYVLPWLEKRPRGLVVLPDQPWNQGLVHPRLNRFINGVNDNEVIAVLREHRLQIEARSKETKK